VISHFVVGEFGKVERTEFGSNQVCLMTYHKCVDKDIPVQWHDRQIMAPNHKAHYDKSSCFGHGE
jgi:hypothetical protein